MNGIGLTSGPPRLRIDNVLNRRVGTSMDLDMEERKRFAQPQSLPRTPQQLTPLRRSSDGGDKVGENRVAPRPETSKDDVGLEEGPGDPRSENDGNARDDNEVQRKQQ